MRIIESNNFSFEEFKGLVEKYEREDWREINFQNRVVLLMLEKMFINDNNIAIVDVSSQYKNRESSVHTRKYYANDSTPDLLIVKNWNYNNHYVKEGDYLAVVEIKSPILAPINNDNKHTTKEIQDYISNGQKVILTDCYKWIFYGFEEEPKTFTLRDTKGWIMSEEENPKFIVKELSFQKRRQVSKVWEDLIGYIELKFSISQFDEHTNSSLLK